MAPWAAALVVLAACLPWPSHGQRTLDATVTTHVHQSFEDLVGGVPPLRGWNISGSIAGDLGAEVGAKAAYINNDLERYLDTPMVVLPRGSLLSFSVRFGPAHGGAICQRTEADRKRRVAATARRDSREEKMKEEELKRRAISAHTIALSDTQAAATQKTREKVLAQKVLTDTQAQNEGQAKKIMAANAKLDAAKAKADALRAKDEQADKKEAEELAKSVARRKAKQAKVAAAMAAREDAERKAKCESGMDCRGHGKVVYTSKDRSCKCQCAGKWVGKNCGSLTTVASCNVVNNGNVKTFDGLSFNMMYPGEFLMFKQRGGAPSGGHARDEVHVQLMTSYGIKRRPDYVGSSVGAVALSHADDVVLIRASYEGNRDSVTVKVNCGEDQGAAVRARSTQKTALTTDAGVKIWYTGNEYHVYTPDRTSLRIALRQDRSWDKGSKAYNCGKKRCRWYMSVYATTRSVRDGSMQGMCGNFDGSWSNDRDNTLGKSCSGKRCRPVKSRIENVVQDSAPYGNLKIAAGDTFFKCDSALNSKFLELAGGVKAQVAQVAQVGQVGQVAAADVAHAKVRFAATVAAAAGRAEGGAVGRVAAVGAKLRGSGGGRGGGRRLLSSSSSVRSQGGALVELLEAVGGDDADEPDSAAEAKEDDDDDVETDREEDAAEAREEALAGRVEAGQTKNVTFGSADKNITAAEEAKTAASLAKSKKAGEASIAAAEDAVEKVNVKDVKVEKEDDEDASATEPDASTKVMTKAEAKKACARVPDDDLRDGCIADIEEKGDDPESINAILEEAIAEGTSKVRAAAQEKLDSQQLELVGEKTRKDPDEFGLQLQYDNGKGWLPVAAYPVSDYGDMFKTWFTITVRLPDEVTVGSGTLAEPAPVRLRWTQAKWMCQCCNPFAVDEVKITSGGTVVALTAARKFVMYVDGVRVGGGRSAADTFVYSVPTNFKIIAVAVTALFKDAGKGLIGYFGMKDVTSRRWKCVEYLSEGELRSDMWTRSMYTDFHWFPAIEKDQNTKEQEPWGAVSGIPKEARWIWPNLEANKADDAEEPPPDTVMKAFCRYNLVDGRGKGFENKKIAAMVGGAAAASPPGDIIDVANRAMLLGTETRERLANELLQGETDLLAAKGELTKAVEVANFGFVELAEVVAAAAGAGGNVTRAAEQAKEEAQEAAAEARKARGSKTAAEASVDARKAANDAAVVVKAAKDIEGSMSSPAEAVMLAAAQGEADKAKRASEEAKDAADGLAAKEAATTDHAKMKAAKIKEDPMVGVACAKSKVSRLGRAVKASKRQMSSLKSLMQTINSALAHQTMTAKEECLSGSEERRVEKDAKSTAKARLMSRNHAQTAMVMSGAAKQATNQTASALFALVAAFAAESKAQILYVKVLKTAEDKGEDAKAAIAEAAGVAAGVNATDALVMKLESMAEGLAGIIGYENGAAQGVVASYKQYTKVVAAGGAGVKAAAMASERVLSMMTEEQQSLGLTLAKVSGEARELEHAAAEARAILPDTTNRLYARREKELERVSLQLSATVEAGNKLALRFKVARAKIAEVEQVSDDEASGKASSQSALSAALNAMRDAQKEASRGNLTSGNGTNATAVAVPGSAEAVVCGPDTAEEVKDDMDLKDDLESPATAFEARGCQVIQRSMRANEMRANGLDRTRPDVSFVPTTNYELGPSYPLIVYVDPGAILKERFIKATRQADPGSLYKKVAFKMYFKGLDKAVARGRERRKWLDAQSARCQKKVNELKHKLHKVHQHRGGHMTRVCQARAHAYGHAQANAHCSYWRCAPQCHWWHCARRVWPWQIGHCMHHCRHHCNHHCRHHHHHHGYHGEWHRCRHSGPWVSGPYSDHTTHHVLPAEIRHWEAQVRMYNADKPKEDRRIAQLTAGTAITFCPLLGSEPELAKATWNNIEQGGAVESATELMANCQTYPRMRFNVKKDMWLTLPVTDLWAQWITNSTTNFGLFLMSSKDLTPGSESGRVPFSKPELTPTILVAASENGDHNPHVETTCHGDRTPTKPSPQLQLLQVKEVYR